MMSQVHSKYAQQGSSLLEVLVTILILSFGLLALAGLSAASLQYSKMAQYQSVGTDLSAEIAERMRANVSAFSNGLYDKTSAYSTANVANAPACAANPCTSAEVAAKDTAAWLQMVRKRLPSGDAFIRRDAVNVLAADLWIMWQEPGLNVTDDASLSTSTKDGCPADAVKDLATTATAPRCMYFRISV